MNKIIKKHPKTFLISFFMIFFLANSTYAAPATIQPTEVGSQLNYVTNTGRFYAKKLKSGEPVYCVEMKDGTPAGKTLSLKSPQSFNTQKKLQLIYVLNNGLINYDSPIKTAYMTGDKSKDYYITQKAVYLVLGQLIRTKFQTDTNNMDAANKAIGNAAIKLYDDAVSNGSNPPTPIGGPVTVSVSPSKLTLYKYYSDFASDWINVTGDNITSYTVTLDGAPGGTTIVRDGMRFWIKVPQSSVGNYSYNMSLTIKALGTTSVPDVSEYSPTNSTLQNVILRTSVSGSGSATTTATASLNNCDTSPLPNSWVQTKTLSLPGTYNIKSGSSNVGTLNINTAYKLNPVVKYDYSVSWDSTCTAGCPISIPGGTGTPCPERPKPAKPLAGSKSGTISYHINYIKEDGTISKTDIGTVSTGNLTIAGSPDSGTVSMFSANPIPINVPNIERLVRADISLDLGGSKLVKSIPIKYSFNKDVSVADVTTSMDGCPNVFLNEEISIRANINSNDIKTQNFGTLMQVSLNGGAYTDVGSKYVFGVSMDSIGQVYYKYLIPETVPNTNNPVTSVKFKCTVYLDKVTPVSKFTGDTNSGNNEKESSSKPARKVNYAEYNDSLPNIRSGFPSQLIASYLKVKKMDKTKETIVKCTNGCQSSTVGGTKTCPGHIEYGWDDEYYAFVLKDTKAVTGVTEKASIESAKYRSKYTTNLKGTGKIDSSGFVDLSKLNTIEKNEYARIKAGYGFELNVDTKYENNLPNRMANVDKSNSAIYPKYLWSTYTVIGGTSVSRVETSGSSPTLLNLLADENSTVILNPGTDAIPYATPNQLFIKMPGGVPLIEGEGLDLTTASGMPENSIIASKPTYRETNDGTSIIREKSFRLKSVNGYRKYYVSENTQNTTAGNKYEATIAMPPVGLRFNCGSNTMVSDNLKFEFNVYGGYMDDLKTFLNE